jgi:hypothetical protein
MEGHGETTLQMPVQAGASVVYFLKSTPEALLKKLTSLIESFKGLDQRGIELVTRYSLINLATITAIFSRLSNMLLFLSAGLLQSLAVAVALSELMLQLVLFTYIFISIKLFISNLPFNLFIQIILQNAFSSTDRSKRLAFI